ncbi:MAG TPA: hypothetical protein VJ276_03180 [Thermoanaerobaculia bacterium]|nr:hypothetical protein [Thermoanaerobaculia bacterium]
MRYLVTDLLSGAVNLGDHPLIAAWLTLIVILIGGLGTLHVSRIFAKFLADVVSEVKHELRGISKIVRRLKRELSTWDEIE